MMNQIIEISNTLQPSEINACISQIEGTIEVSTNVQGKETLNAINSLMTNQQLTTLEKDQFERILNLYTLFLNNSTLCED